MYCSPTADMLRTFARVSVGIRASAFSETVATTFVGSRSTAVTFPTCTPRSVTLLKRYRPPLTGSSTVTVVRPIPSNVGTWR